MGKCSRTNGIRIKRSGLETVKQRHKRQLREADQVTVKELRVVRRKRSEKMSRAPEGLRAKSPQWEIKLKALLKLNKEIKNLLSRQEAGDDLDEQQLRKIERRDDILLQIDSILSKHRDVAHEKFGKF
uniref:Uncharacterized protein n=1 Tax=Aureoumbra lagunensis TaxID=44058 RepID=A0A7S3NKF6_9STRA|mmetsp:Transcript_4009/g.5256  ORF Transcript_4009/g.5256 Transcript_4009/m.5256 type:complete len:128 (+) Transcript_4009:24-407(+)